MRAIIVLALILFCLNAFLCYPLFLPGEFPYRDSIEGGYASMARFFAENPNPWGWNPTQYCGQPSQYTYLPVVHYLTGFFHLLLPSAQIEHVYRVITATAACLAPVSLFLFVVYFGRSRKWAFAVAMTYTFFSPIYMLFQQIEKDRGFVQLPWRIQVLVKYGEGPHTVAFALLPIALIAIWRAAVKPGFGRLLVAAIAMAAIALTNWLGSMALAWCSLALIATSFAHRRETGFKPSRVFAAAGIAYGLALFWLTPTFISVTALNWPKDAFNYQFGIQKVLLLLGLAATGLALAGLGWLVRSRPLFGFALVLAAGFGFVVANFYWFGVDTIPESRRYALEFEAFMLVAAFELLRLVLSSKREFVRYAAIGLVVLLYSAGVRQCFAYVTKEDRLWAPVPKERTQEYDLSRFLTSQNPSGRVYVSGGLRFRINQWFSIQQVGGTFESGLRNRVPVDLAYQIRTGRDSKPGMDGRDAIAELQVMGTQFVVVNGPKSKEHYRDFDNPAKFQGLLQPIRDDGGNTVYRVPFASLASLVRPEELPRSPRLHGTAEGSTAFTNALNDQSRPKLQATWRGSSRLEIEGPIPEGMVAAVSVNWDEGWEADQDGLPLLVETNKLGLIVMRPKPAQKSVISMTYHPSWEQTSAAGISLQVWIVCFALLWREKKSRKHATG